MKGDIVDAKPAPRSNRTIAGTRDAFRVVMATTWQELDRASKLWAITVMVCCLIVLAILMIWAAT
jgi:hypothetical protein